MMRRFCVIGILLAFSACGGDSSTSPTATPPAVTPAPTPTPTPTPGASAGSFSFRLDGTLVPGTNVTATLAAGILSIGGGNTSTNTTLGFAFQPTAAGVGTYTLGPLSSANAFLLVGNPAQGWNAAVGIGSGSITLNTFTATTASGTFQFVLNPQPGASGIRNVTEGAFTVTFTKS